LDHGLHVVSRLAIADQLDELVVGPAAVALLPPSDRVLAGVVGGERLHARAAVAIEEAAQQRGAEVDVDRHPVQRLAVRRRRARGGGEVPCGARQQLHQAVGVGGRDGVGDEQALLPDEGGH